MEQPQGDRPRRSFVVIGIIIFGGLVLAVANVAVLLGTVPRSAPGATSSLLELYRLCPPCLAYFVAAPLVIVILLATIVARRLAGAEKARPGTPERQVAQPAPPSPAPALRLLGLLQQEGRFLDFLAEDIDAYSDAQVGAAVRSIHAGCRKALRDRISLERVLAQEEGSTVVVDADFDRTAVRLTGNVTGAPPFHGTLQHGGWRVTHVSLPESPGGADTSIVAAAEVEIP